MSLLNLSFPGDRGLTTFLILLPPIHACLRAAGVDYARQNETATTLSAIGVVALILPTTRRMLWRATFGRFRSEEAAQMAAEQRLTAFTTTVDAQAGEVEKLSQRLSLAQQEYARGLAKLQSTAGELRNLLGRVEKTESKTRMFMDDLRELRAKHALQMRSEAAVQADKSGKQRRTLERLVSALTKDGF